MYGWLVMIGENDMVDIYEERFNFENEWQYWFEGEWCDMEVCIEMIEVNGVEFVLFEVFCMVYGLIMEWDKENQCVFLRCLNFWKKEFFGFFFLVECVCVSDWDGFECVIEFGMVGSYNVVYGDVFGYIEYWYIGFVLICKEGVDLWFLLLGIGEFEWFGYCVLEDWFNVVNLEQGYFYVWNSKFDCNICYGDMLCWGKYYCMYLLKVFIEVDDFIIYVELEEMNKVFGVGFVSYDLSIIMLDFFQLFFDVVVENSDDLVVCEVVGLFWEWDGFYFDDDCDGFYDYVGVVFFCCWMCVVLDMFFGDEFGDWWWKFDEEIYVKY